MSKPGLSFADSAPTDTVVDVAAGQAGVAIRCGLPGDSMLTARKLSASRRMMVASSHDLARRGTPTRREDLHRHNCFDFNFLRVEPVWPFRIGGRDVVLSLKGSIEARFRGLSRDASGDARGTQRAFRTAAGVNRPSLSSGDLDRRWYQATLAAIRAASFSSSVHTLRTRSFGGLTCLTGPPPSTGARFVECRATSQCHS